LKLNLKIIFSLFYILYAAGSYAGVEVHEFTDEGKSAQYKVLIEELRCLVCQNQNLADSNAELARDLRQQVYEMINAGKSNEEIVTYMVNRYGDFVLYRPPLKSSTVLLWFGPFVIFLVGIIILIMFVRNLAKNKRDEINEEEQLQVREMLREELTTTDKTEQNNKKQD